MGYEWFYLGYRKIPTQIEKSSKLLKILKGGKICTDITLNFSEIWALKDPKRIKTGSTTFFWTNEFKLKKNNDLGVGYYNGSLSENEVNKEADWDAKNILERGISLLNFMEERWHIKLGDYEFKVKLLHLDFVTKADF